MAPLGVLCLRRRRCRISAGPTTRRVRQTTAAGRRGRNVKSIFSKFNFSGFLSAASVWGVFSVGFFFRGWRFHRRGLMYTGGVSGAWALDAGSGVFLVTFCNGSASSTRSTSRRRLWSPSSLCVYISPEKRFCFPLAAPPFALALGGGLRVGRRGMCGLWGAASLKLQWAATPWGPCWVRGRGGVGGEGRGGVAGVPAC